MMKIAFCLFKYFPFGGLQRDMLLMAEKAASRGHEIHIFCGSWQGERPENMSIQLLGVSGISNAAKTKYYVQQLHSALNRQNFDLIVGFNKMPGLDLYFAADSCFAYKAYREKSWLYRQFPRSRIYLKYEEAVFGNNSKTEILEISQNEHLRFVELYNTEPHRFHNLPPGILRNRAIPENANIVRKQARSALGFTDQQPILLALGSGFKTKGLDRAINTVATLAKTTLPNIQLMVVGQDHPDAFKKQASKLGIAKQVHFLGGRDDIPELLQAADLLIHLAYKENSGIALLEAAIAGLPVLTTDVCGYSHFITEADMGHVITAPYNAQQATKAVEQLLSCGRDQWLQRGRHFANSNDLYSLHDKAVAIMEMMGEKAG